MDVVQLDQNQLAARWCINDATLERWRSAGIGRKFLMKCSVVSAQSAADRLAGAAGGGYGV
jgi:hypothetical protein